MFKGKLGANTKAQPDPVAQPEPRRSARAGQAGPGEFDRLGSIVTTPAAMAHRGKEQARERRLSLEHARERRNSRTGLEGLGLQPGQIPGMQPVDPSKQGVRESPATVAGRGSFRSPLTDASASTGNRTTPTKPDRSVQKYVRPSSAGGQESPPSPSSPTDRRDRDLRLARSYSGNRRRRSSPDRDTPSSPGSPNQFQTSGQSLRFSKTGTDRTLRRAESAPRYGDQEESSAGAFHRQQIQRGRSIHGRGGSGSGKELFGSDDTKAGKCLGCHWLRRKVLPMKDPEPLGDNEEPMLVQYLSNLDQVGSGFLSELHLWLRHKVLRKEIDELDYLVDRVRYYNSAIASGQTSDDSSPHWIVFRALACFHDEFTATSQDHNSSPFLEQLIMWFEQECMENLNLMDSLPTEDDVRALQNYIRHINRQTERLPCRSDGDEWTDMAAAIEALKAWEESYPFLGKPKNKAEAIRLAKAVKHAMTLDVPDDIRNCPLIYMIFIGITEELFGPGATRRVYRAVKDAFSNLLSDTDLPSLADETFGWAVLPIRIFTERHLRLLDGDVHKIPSEVKHLASELLRIRNCSLPRFQLRLVHIRSIRHTHMDVVSSTRRKFMCLGASMAMGLLNLKRFAIIDEQQAGEAGTESATELDTSSMPDDTGGASERLLSLVESVVDAAPGLLAARFARFSEAPRPGGEDGVVMAFFSNYAAEDGVASLLWLLPQTWQEVLLLMTMIVVNMILAGGALVAGQSLSK